MLLRLVLLLTVLASPAAAEKTFTKFQKDYQGPELEFLRKYCFEISSMSDYFQSGDKKVSDLAVAFYDLNDDGEDEMLVIMPFGGSAGNSFYLFQKRKGQWEVIGDNVVTSIWITGARVAGYLTLYAHLEGLRWGPARNKYWQFCRNECDYDGAVQEED
ncbi:MAG: hypothetical protein EXQ86_07525 [Rhodospirillales bacterium]|nr:hypothetical protein [Rhodospirillales bacterium]